uniref:Uncharacterized protein n=1 Tax=Romanomermis culicivorax TaxID=13658 RepID=A0A915L2Y2_ROMCU
MDPKTNNHTTGESFFSFFFELFGAHPIAHNGAGTFLHVAFAFVTVVGDHESFAFDSSDIFRIRSANET